MKDSYYFSHDSNALIDPKILEMRCDYGMEGYGIFWAIIEMLRNQEEYKQKLNTTTYKGLKMLCMTDVDIEEFISKCINEYNLFKTDGEYFWTDSLCRRMGKKDDLIQKRKEAAQKRWNKDDNTNDIKNCTDEMQEECKCNASAEQNKKEECKCNANAIQRKLNKIKGNEIKESKELKNNNSSELLKAAEQEEKPIIELTLNDKSQYPILKADINRWSELYPAVDIIQELRKMAGWLEANPQKRKTKRGIKKFINSWLSKAQDKGGNLVGQPRSTTLSAEEGAKSQQFAKPNKFCNYEHREWDFEALNKLKQEQLDRGLGIDKGEF